MGAETEGSWIPGLALLARNDERVGCVIPAHAGIQGVWRGLDLLAPKQETEPLPSSLNGLLITRNSLESHLAQRRNMPL